MNKEKIRRMCISGVFCAVVFVFTAYLHIPSHTGYTHIGDAFIYLAACILPLPYALFVGAGGALLADCLTGFAIWAPGSVIMKALAVLFFSRRGGRIITVRNLVALLPAGLACIGGYYLYESLITWNFASPVAGIPGNIMQTLFSSAAFVLIGVVLDRLHVTEKLIGKENDL